MQPRQQRIIDDKMELDSKLKKLTRFIDSDFFNNLSRDKQSRLERQREIMEQYSDILGERNAAYWLHTLAEWLPEDKWRRHACLGGGGLPFNLSDYLELVGWSGRIIREDKRGYIPDNLPTILQRLDMNARHWIYLTNNFEQPFKNLVGAGYLVRKACEDIGRNWVHGISQCERLFSSS